MISLPRNFPRCCSVGVVFCIISVSLADESERLALAPRPASESPAAHRSRLSTAELLGDSTLRTVASGLAIVLGLFALLTALMRSQQGRRQSTALLQTLGAIQITPKVQLHVVRFGNRLLVLHLSPDSVQRVAEINDADEVNQLLGLYDQQSPTGVSPQVEQLLQSARGLPLRAVDGGVA